MKTKTKSAKSLPSSGTTKRRTVVRKVPAATDLGASLRIREKGRCYDCGEGVRAEDGHSHSRFTEYGGTAFASDHCCACVGHRVRKQ